MTDQMPRAKPVTVKSPPTARAHPRAGERRQTETAVETRADPGYKERQQAQKDDARQGA